MEPYKKVELLTQLFNQLSQDLVIVGEGREEHKLKRTANKNIIFLKNLTDQELGILYSNAEALIMPQEEDFGYVSLEAQFFGCPVIAYRKGGVSETAIEGKTGIFFDEQSVKSLKSALIKFNMVKYELKHKTEEFGQKNVVRFSRNKFEKSFESLCE